MLGQIPTGLQNATNLIELYIRNTQISGPIPVFFKNLALFHLDLSGNKLTGTIPDTLINNESGISTIDLHNNQLTGPIPPAIRAIVLDLSYNKLSGPLANNLSDYGSWLRLNNNKFTGTIPDLHQYFNELNISSNLLEYVDPINCGASLSLDTGKDLDFK